MWVFEYLLSESEELDVLLMEYGKAESVDNEDRDESVDKPNVTEEFSMVVSGDIFDGFNWDNAALSRHVRLQVTWPSSVAS